MIRRSVQAGENALLALVFASIVLIPVLEAVLRKALHTGITGSAVLVQHLTLLASMIGAAVAVRDGKLLTLFNVIQGPGTSRASAARAVAHMISAAVAGMLCVASVALVISERAAGTTLMQSLPVWVAQAILPTGFALVTVRLVLSGADNWGARVAMGVVVGTLLATVPLWSVHVSLWFYPALAALVAAVFIGAPVFVVLGGTAILLFGQQLAPIASLALDHYRLVVNPALPAIPLFTLAGFFLAAGDAPRRLTGVFQALFGHFRGGVAVAAVVVAAFFTAFTGASGVTILALGGLLLPLLSGARYREPDALGLVAGSGSLGALLPPCLPVVLYAIVAKVSIEQMFLGAFLPGVLMIALAAVWGVRRDRRTRAEIPRFDWTAARSAVGAAKWELCLPVIALGGLLGGAATPVEAAAFTALYAFTVEAVVHGGWRRPQKLLTAAIECGALVGGVLLILGVALGLTNYLIDIQLPEWAVAWVTQTIQSKALFLLSLNALLLVAGCLMDVFSAIIVLAPIVVPIGLAFGVDPVHLGVIFLANLELGYLTPPVGVNLFYASSRFGKPISEICRAVAPLLLPLAAGVLLITYVPWMSTALPALFR